jgi:DNA-binding transcriptional MerR regulator
VRAAGADTASEPARAAKADAAFRTIGEVTQATGIAPHILRYWEGRFPQLKPVTRAGNRRYYRPADVALVQRIDRLLNHEGYTVRGVQQLLAGERKPGEATAAPSPTPAPDAVATVLPDTIDAIRLIRDYLREGLDADG